eukprot:9255871-Pyramimonas_sp.AAC.1
MATEEDGDGEMEEEDCSESTGELQRAREEDCSESTGELQRAREEGESPRGGAAEGFSVVYGDGSQEHRALKMCFWTPPKKPGTPGNFHSLP